MVLRFQVAHHACALRADQVQEIVAIAATTKVPGQPTMLEGFLNLRGTVVPVVRMATLFNLPFESSMNASVIILRTHSGSLGLLVDEVESVVGIDSGDLRALSANHSANEYAEAEFAVDGRNVVLLESGRLLLAEEKRRIGELQSQVERRVAALEGAET